MIPKTIKPIIKCDKFNCKSKKEGKSIDIPFSIELSNFIKYFCKLSLNGIIINELLTMIKIAVKKFNMKDK